MSGSASLSSLTSEPSTQAMPATPVTRGRPTRVVMVSAELDPFARTGGLGDVVSGLSAALARRGLDVAIVTPLYGVTRVPRDVARWERPVTVPVGSGSSNVRTLGVLEVVTPGGRPAAPRVFFLDDPGLFARDGIYGDAHGVFGDNDVRFTAMSRGALEVAARIWEGDHPEDAGVAVAGSTPRGPDVIHAHDWHAAPAVISSRLTMGAEWARTETIFTLHNLSFQGVFSEDALDRLGLPRAAFDDGRLAHRGQVNLMRGAIALSDRVTTVSPTYAREIMTPREGCGLDPVLREHRGKVSGILNGIDVDRFDPRTDSALAAPYGDHEPLDAKRTCKRALAAALGLAPDEGPLFASVSRLTEQKGIDLLLSVVPALVEEGARIVLVGAGEHPLEEGLRAVAGRYPGRVACRIAFDDALARQVYAGADFFVVPSRYEPCGLTQLYAMRYGAIPVVTSVGGLRDTVQPIRVLFETGTGFVAEGANAAALLVACEDALSLYRDPPSHRAAVARAMSRDSSWLAPGAEYAALYDAPASGELA